MISEQILLGKDEVASIATEDEDALLASDSEDHNTVTELKGNGTFEKVIDLEDGELEDGEIGVNDVNEDDDPNICRFVVAGTNSDLHSIPTNSFKKLELTQESINSLNNSRNGLDLTTDLYFRLKENCSSSMNNNLFKRNMVNNYIKSIPTQKSRRFPYNMSEIRARKTIKDEIACNMMSDIERPSSPALSLNHLLDNFKNIHVSENQNTSDKYDSKVLSKPTLKLPQTNTDVQISNEPEANNSDDDVCVIAVVPASESRLNREVPSARNLFSANENKVQNACAQLDNLQISGMPKSKSQNLFWKPKPNLLASIMKNKHINSRKLINDSQTQSMITKLKLMQHMLSQNEHVRAVPRVFSDQPVSTDGFRRYREPKSGLNKYELKFNNVMKHLEYSQRIFQNAKDNSWIKNPNITDPLLQTRVKIVFGGIFTILDRHRFHDLCRANDRYIEDFKVNKDKSQGLVLCRSTNSAIKFISQRPIEHVRKYRVIKVEEKSNLSYDFYEDSD